MSLMRPLSDIRDQMERVFNEIESFQLPTLESFKPFRERMQQHRAWLPAVDVSETGTHYEMKIEIPGIKQEDLKMEVLNDAVVIRGQSQDEKMEHKKDYYYRECHMGSVYRRIPLPGAVRRDNVTAELSHGVLDVKLPKAETEKGMPVKIQVK